MGSTKVEFICCEVSADNVGSSTIALQMRSGLLIKQSGKIEKYIAKPFVYSIIGDQFFLKSAWGSEAVVNYNTLAFAGTKQDFIDQLNEWACSDCAGGSGSTTDNAGYYYDQSGADLDGAAIAPVTVPASPQNGDTVIERFDDVAAYWTYNSGSWTLNFTTPTSIAGITVQSTHVAYFDQINAQDVFTVDTGHAGLVAGDVVSVQFIFNGAEQPDTSNLPNATTTLGSHYNGFTIVSDTQVRIQTNSTIGETQFNDWAILRVVINE